MHKLSITVRYTVIGLAIALAHLIWRSADHGITGSTGYELPYILTMLAIPPMIGYAVALYRIQGRYLASCPIWLHFRLT
jgi:hypothetical protein